MKKAFQCFATMSQSKDENEQVVINIAGRVLEKLRINDTLCAKEGQYVFEATILEIISYGKNLEEIYPAMSCSLILKANTFLNNSVENLDSVSNA
jgi:hypothetical protein